MPSSLDDPAPGRQSAASPDNPHHAAAASGSGSYVSSTGSGSGGEPSSTAVSSSSLGHGHAEEESRMSADRSLGVDDVEDPPPPMAPRGSPPPPLIMPGRAHDDDDDDHPLHVRPREEAHAAAAGTGLQGDRGGKSLTRTERLDDGEQVVYPHSDDDRPAASPPDVTTDAAARLSWAGEKSPETSAPPDHDRVPPRQTTIDDRRWSSSSGSAAAARAEEEAARQPFFTKLTKLFLGSLNFYRIHMLAFILIPFAFSGIFYAVNTVNHVAYIDCLFVCVSAMTVTGLATINLSELNGGQQAILFFLMNLGGLALISMVMIVVRQHFFRREFKHIIDGRRRARAAEAKRRADEARENGDGSTPGSPLRRLRRLSQSFSRANTNEKEPRHHHHPHIHPQEVDENKAPHGDASGIKGALRWRDLFRHPPPDNPATDPAFADRIKREPSPMRSRESSASPPTSRATSPKRPAPGRSGPSWFGRAHQPKVAKLRTDMIKRVEGGGVGLINPMGWYQQQQQQHEQAQAHEAFTPSAQPGPGILENAVDTSEPADYALDVPARRFSDPPNARHSMLAPANDDDRMPRTKTIAFDRPEDHAAATARDTTGFYSHRAARADPEGGYLPRTGTIRSIGQGNVGLHRTATGRRSVNQQLPGSYGRIMTRTVTTTSNGMSRTMTINQQAKHTGYGGFPTPFAIIKQLFRKLFPKAVGNLERTLTMQRNPTYESNGEVKSVNYISFDAVVGRNSHFHDLSKEESDELGGVEYRALRVLLWIVAAYWVLVQLFAFIISAPYLAAGNRYAAAFVPPALQRSVGLWWYAAFNTVSAFTNTGMSLVDQSMVPFQTAYLFIVVTMFLIFAGNTSFPIFLRLNIWGISKFVPANSRLHETLKFLLDHPRRCFVYLFPSTQTWFLVLVMVSLTLTDWVSFMVLDIGNTTIESIPVATRIAAGFLQSTAVRAAGFGIVPLAALSPAVQVLYVIMMYISVYPIAMSIRSTNVYEERSLGIFDEIDPNEEEPQNEGRGAIIKYLGWHARRQLAFDIWWLAASLWIVCIIERGSITNPDNYGWFTIFSVLFELVSAYGTVGLSLGLPYDNYSLSGAFSTLAKLVVIAVMIRGRHRGLPVAIDRAVMLPKDFSVAEENAFNAEADRLSRARSRREGSLTATARGGSFSFPVSGNSTRRRGSTIGSPVLSPQSNSAVSAGGFGGQMYFAEPDNIGDVAAAAASPPTTGHQHARKDSAGDAAAAGARSLSPIIESNMSRNTTIATQRV